MRGSRRQGVVIGSGAMAIGVGLFVAAHLYPQKASAPLFVVDAAAAAFFCAGVIVVAEVFGQRLLSRLAGLALIYLLAVPGLWMLFAGDGACTIGGAVSGLTMATTGSDFTCRAAFGLGGVVVLAVALLMSWQALRGRHRPQASLQDDPPRAI